MSKKMLIDAGHPEETRVALISKGKVEDFDFESQSRKPLRGNIYLARVTRVEPSLQAAFIEYGGNRHGFLAFSEIHPDYYQVPVNDRDILKKAEQLEAELAAQIQAEEAAEEDNPKPKAKRGRRRGRNRSRDEDAPVADEEMAEDLSDEDEAEAEDAVEARVIAEDDLSDDDESDETAEDEDGTIAATAEDVETADDSDVEELDDEVQSSRAALMAEAVAEDSLDVDVDTDEAPREKSLEDRYRDARRDRVRLMRNYKIQEVVKRRQILLIQVVKEERGNKGAALTTYLSLAGRYCVLMPNTARGGGISRKITNASDRKRLRKAVAELDIPEGIGLIIRTAGSSRTKAEIKRDYDYLIRLWATIRDLTLKSIAPCLIYEEASLIKRAIRDLYDKDISEVIVEGDEGYREAKDFMKMLMPSHAKNVQPYKERVPLFLAQNVEKQLDEMYQPNVKLKSGGYLVIQQTEALISIDVNSGRATKERNIEATALKTNLEAAAEVARQCRLRDLAGLVIIDFIDMDENRNNRAVEKKMKEAMKVDRARIQLSRISSFGLMELSRQRRRSGIVDGTTNTCPTCQGAGAVRSHEMAALRILRAVEEEALSGKVGIVTVRTSLDVALYILNHKRDWINRIEETYAISAEIIADTNKAGDHYDIDSRGTPRVRTASAPVVRPDLIEIEVDDEPETTVHTPEADATEDDERPRKRRRRRRRGGRKPEGEEQFESGTDDATGEAEVSDSGSTPADETSREDDREEPRKRRRGRRGGRRNRRRSEGESDQPANDAGDQSTEAAAPDVAPLAEIVDETTPQPEAEAEVKKPRKRRAKKKVLVEAEEQPATSETDASPTEDEPKAKKAKKKAAKKPTKKATKKPAKKAAKETPTPDAEIAAIDVPEEPKKPRRAGWWQRALKG